MTSWSQTKFGAVSSYCGESFVFPKDIEKRKIWINFVNKLDFMPKKSSVLCFLRLLQNALPTIEVNRLKYVRTYNPLLGRTAIREPVQHEKETYDEAGPSTPVCTSPPNVPGRTLIEDSPSKKNLKRKIKELEERDIVKSKKIRKLQKNNWRQKKCITSLKSVISELKKKNVICEEDGNIVLDNF
ncbi:hypothetical protein ABEB36_014134 [Hypothenemus hampei]|uniref:THAP-type domain-containing protein n=1 Tax=Hypothenemus hampei TaxID=57062 RepID=A0ABD1E3E3_HYPHA